MEKARKSGIRASHQDDLAVIKAAAWAWYQHSSSGEGKIPVREFDVVQRTRREPRPSRYRLEVMRRIEEEAVEAARISDGSESINSDSNGSVLLSPTKTDMSLFDAYEIQRISMQLDRILESSRRFSSDDGERPDRSPKQRPEISGGRSGKKKSTGGFWFRSAVAACGIGRGDVVDPVALIGRRRGKYVEVARMQSSRAPPRSSRES